MVGQHYFTWCVGGTGLGESSGFQTRARSPSISPEVERAILRYCTKYEMPRSLSALTTKVSDLTDEELAQVPVSVHYFAIGSELRGLTRMRLRAEQSGRGGNFLAHTLVFPVTDLKRARFNPFEVIRSGVFVDTDAGKPKQLDELPELPLARTGRGDGEDPSTLNPYAIEKLFHALVVKPEDRRPVILLPSMTREERTLTPRQRAAESAALIETALLLLPDDTRGQVSFSTYELDPYRLLESGGLPLQVVATMSRTEGGSFEFREDEYKASFYVVNLTDNRTSEIVPACSQYARLADEALAHPLSPVADEFEQRRHLMGMLHVGLAPQVWDALAPAGVIATTPREAPMADWHSAARVLAVHCTDPASAKCALELLSNNAAPEVARDGLLLLAGAGRGKPGPVWYMTTAGLVLLSMMVAAFVARQFGPVTSAQEQPRTLKSASVAQVVPSQPVATKSASDVAQERPVPVLATQGLTGALVGPGVQVTETKGLVNVVFDTTLFGDSDGLLPGGRSQFLDLVRRIPKDKVGVIQVIGKTDSRPIKGRADIDNYDLGYRRAVVAAREMRGAGLPASLFQISSTGAEQPVHGDPADSRNRTVVLRFEPAR